jgi:hypothetical protein
VNKPTILLARMVYGGYERADLGTWLTAASVKLAVEGFQANGKRHQIGNVLHTTVDHQPVYKARNMVIKYAQLYGADYVVMVDHDVIPPLDFVEKALAVFLEQDRFSKIGVVVSPTLIQNGKNTNCFRYDSHAYGFGVLRYVPITAQEGSMMSGLHKVDAAGTGAIMIDCAVFKKFMDHYGPEACFFDHEYSDHTKSEIATGEDVFFTRSVDQMGVDVVADFDCWSKHYKTYCYEKPEPIDSFMIPSLLREKFELAMAIEKEKGAPHV